jgi:O-Antigen ligase
MQTAAAEPRAAPLTLSAKRARGANIAAWALGFAAPLYLAMKGGGYEEVLRDQVGVALWWLVLVGALVGVLPAARPSRAQLTALGALVAFAAWTGLGATWSQSSGRTVSELSRLSCYAAVLALAVLTVRAGAKSALIAGVASAIGTVAVLALLSRLHPGWFPANETARFFGPARLSYPLNYWNGVAALVAMGVPLMVHLACSARRFASRMLAAAALPAMAATIYLTFSRGGWVELGAASIVLIALSSGSAWRLATLAIGAGGGALLIAAIRQRPAIDQGLSSTAAGHSAGNELIAIALVVCAGAALLQGALVLLEDHVEAGRAMRRSRSLLPRAPLARTAVAIVATACAVGIFVAAGGPHAAAQAWSSFKSPVAHEAKGAGPTGHLLMLSGEGRYQMWSSTLRAFETNPLGGIGAGTFQLWWAAHGSIYGYVINAHSLYFETLGETGLVGIALLLLALGAGVAGTLRRLRLSARVRAEQAAILAAFAAFAVAASVDWVWQIPTIPVVALLLLGAGAAGAARRGSALGKGGQRPATTGSARGRLAWVVLAALGTATIVVPMAGAVSVRSSQTQAQAGRLAGALHSAKTASGWQPYASAPALQQALVLEQQGNLAAAAAAARRATDAAGTDWRAWLVRSRIEAERGVAKAALADWSKARSLDPKDPLFRTAASSGNAKGR